MPNEAEQIEALFADDTLPRHAERAWQAETENARRQSARAILLLSVLAAMFGLGLFKIEWTQAADDVARIPSGYAVFAIKAALTLAIASFAAAFLGAISRRKSADEKTLFASGRLRLPAAVIRQDSPTTARTRWFVFRATYGAVDDLRCRNERERRRLDAAQQWLIIGLGLVLVAMLVYTWSGNWPN
ncbi:MAG: hypothetical protein IID40_09180 [Planctomycetes bacterium]|nr:hypothetical protein [Planctomycetota bacterium]